jgi:hypothetical protein
MNYELQVVTVPFSDVDQALAFYTGEAGFHLDVDYHPASQFRVVQLTPSGSACSIQIGVGLTDPPPGSARATYLAVTDIEAAHPELTAGVSRSAPSGTSGPSTNGPVAGNPALTRNAATTPASLTFPTRTATPGRSRRSATTRHRHPVPSQE